jgi:hypothetical protein
MYYPYGYQLDSLNGHPVSNINEAKAAQIIPNGTMYYYPSIGEEKIYVKSTDMNGSMVFNIFTLSKEKDRSETILDTLQAKIQSLEKAVSELKEKKHEPDTNDYDVTTV